MNQTKIEDEINEKKAIDKRSFENRGFTLHADKRLGADRRHEKFAAEYVLVFAAVSTMLPVNRLVAVSLITFFRNLRVRAK
jgi:hypothetical protein